ncbi:MAG: asparagine synthase, partial [Deltaproteobacteria bacterium]|nr:asparagine synthase [Deltaproteobacteria bacterium]
RQTFDDAVNLRRICDVPVGVLLSGGLDSSSVVASMAAQGVTDVATFTVRFEEAYYDESPLARNLARSFGMEYHDLVVSERELLDLVYQSSWLNDEPLAHANDPHLLAISHFAKPRVSVLLSGEGADETMGGYVRYRGLRMIEWLRWARPLGRPMAGWLSAAPAGTFSSRVQKLQRMLELNGPEEFVLFNACDVLPGELDLLGMEGADDDFSSRRQKLTEAAALYPNDIVRQAMYLDQQTFLVSILDRNDRTTMGASIECRVPFLDYRLVEGLAALRSEVLFRGNKSKPLMREAFGRRLPAEILQHRKWGFGVPWQKYFQKRPEFREIVASLPDAPPIKDGPFDRAAVKRVINAFLAGDLKYHALVRQLFFIAIWHKVCVADVRPGFRADLLTRGNDVLFDAAAARRPTNSH